MHVYRFRNCLLNTLERSVIKEDQYVELTTRTFDVLQFLIERAGHVVTKDELLGNPNTIASLRPFRARATDL